MKIKRDLSSHGKSWLFHFDETCLLKGYLFPSGYRLYTNGSELSLSDMFLIENRNILKFHYGLLGAIIPCSPIVGINSCKLVLFQNVDVNHPMGIFVTYLIVKKMELKLIPLTIFFVLKSFNLKRKTNSLVHFFKLSL